MEIKLNSLIIENFKGIRKFAVEFANRTIITAENGIGKTSVCDGFLWVLFDKDSTGRKDFDLRPLDENNQPIKGLVLTVEASLDIDGETHIFRKENHEKIVKDQLRGYETLCFIDEVPKKVSEYAEYIEENLVTEDVFKMLTNLRHFNEGLHHTERRKALLAIAGEIGTPEGFDELLAELNGRTVKEYKDVLKTRKGKLEDEREEINPRIDEIQNGLKEYAGADVKKLQNRRDVITADINGLDKDRKDLLAKESQRQQQIENLNNLKSKLAEREVFLKTDTSSIQKQLDEKTNIETKLANFRQKVADARNAVALQKTEIDGKRNVLNTLTASLQDIKEKYKAAKAANIETDCPTCGQQLPADRIDEIKLKHSKVTIEITQQGNEVMKKVKACEVEIAELEGKLNELIMGKEKLEADLKDGEAYKAEKFVKFVKIEDAIKNRKTTPPTADKTWQDINIEIGKAEKEIGAPVSKQLEDIENMRKSKQTLLTEVNNALAQSDRAKQDKARIEKLAQDEKDLAQKIADIDKQLNDIANYDMENSKLIEESVNHKFKHVKFKLFEYLLNGEINPCCEATLNGVPYSDLSYGQRIFVGIDIINILSEHYGMSVPLFIDNAEGLTLPVEFIGQTILLFAQKGISTLTVENIADEKPIQKPVTGKKKTTKTKELFNVA